MITGHCSGGWHHKCPDGRCSCACHAETTPIEENTVPEIPCGLCARTFGSNQAAAVHRARGHKPKQLPVEEGVERTAPPSVATTALYAITGWYGGLYIDLTVSTGTDLIDPDTLRAVIGLTRVLEAE